MPTVIDLANLGSAGFAIQGDAAKDYAGWSVSSAGDINGDGFDDVIVGAPFGDDDSNAAGEAYVVFGKAGGFGTVDLGNLGAAGFIIQGDALLDKAGWSVSSAGDVNGDGFDDMIVGVPYGNDAAGNAGEAYVIFGKASGFGTVDLSSLGASGFIIQGDASGYHAGWSVASAGDVNGDGFDDMIVGSPQGDNGGEWAGEAYVVFGHSGGFGTVDLANLGSAGFIIQGDFDGDQAGWSVSSAGDFNGDGFDDLIVGSAVPNGEAYVVFGHSGGFGTVDISTLGSAGFMIQGPGETHFSVSAAGDVNGDGYADVIVGAPMYNPDPMTVFYPGAAFVVFGKASGFGTVDLANLGAGGFIIRGTANSETGYSVSAAGDVNGDGFDDVIVGARAIGSSSNAGAAYVVYGKASGFGTVDLTNLASADGFKVTGAGGDHAGWSVDGAGDVNGDGFDDLIVGAPYNSAGGGAAGKAYVVFGFATPVPGVALAGGTGNDTLVGTNGNDTLTGGGGSDYLVGLGGNDILTGSADAPSTLQGGKGDDWYYVSRTGDSVLEAAGEGNDRIVTSASYTLSAGQSIETMTTSDQAGTAPISLTGNALGQVIFGNAGANVLTGGGGVDYLLGLGGNDILFGNADASSTLQGGAGDDWYYILLTGDSLVEFAGEGNDRILTSVSYTLSAGQEIETLIAATPAGSAELNLAGNGFAQFIQGTNGANILAGDGGADQLSGLGGSDVLLGGDGEDFLNGGGASDVLNGGAGADFFVFADALGAGNIDTIQDFASGSDRIALDHNVFTGLSNGVLSASAFATGAAAQDSDDQVIYDSATGALWFDADGSGAGAAVQFATLSGHPPLAASDFVVI